MAHSHREFTEGGADDGRFQIVGDEHGGDAAERGTRADVTVEPGLHALIEDDPAEEMAGIARAPTFRFDDLRIELRPPNDLPLRGGRFRRPPHADTEYADQRSRQETGMRNRDGDRVIAKVPTMLTPRRYHPTILSTDASPDAPA